MDTFIVIITDTLTAKIKDTLSLNITDTSTVNITDTSTVNLRSLQPVLCTLLRDCYEVKVVTQYSVSTNKLWTQKP